MAAGEYGSVMTLTFTVHGTPAPQGSKSFKGHSKSGKAILIESSKAVKPWREAVKWAALEAMRQSGNPRFPMRGPLAVTVVFTLPRPKSMPKRVLWPATRPDGDKLLRATHDALKDAGLIQDDGQIVREWWAKAYPGWNGGIGGIGFPTMDSPGAVIEVRTI